MIGASRPWEELVGETEKGVLCARRGRRITWI